MSSCGTDVLYSAENAAGQGGLGVVQEGALADPLLLEGDPIANINLIDDPARNLLVIMKDGRIYKNAPR
jgi:imidazolonepropionase-like amidohydrolase